MDIEKYINWEQLWKDKVNLDFDYDITDYEQLMLRQFKRDIKVELIPEECFINIVDVDIWEFVFQFSESGGQNESDTQGWSRDYFITVDENFYITEIQYQQG